MKIAFEGYRGWALKIKEKLPYKFVDVDDADIVLYYGWSKIIPAKIFNSKLCLILHPSPLPKYRGGSPLQHQIMAGEKTSAVTICKVDDGIDEGDIYSQTKFSLKGTLNEIFERIINIGIKDTLNVISGIGRIDLAVKPQKGKPSLFKRRKPEESELKLLDLQRMSSKQIYNFIRALADPYPNAFIRCVDGKKLYITGAHL